MLVRNTICHVKLFCDLNMEKISVLCVFKKRKPCAGTLNYYTTDKFKGKIISEFIGLKSKMYSLITVDNEEVKKANE